MRSLALLIVRVTTGGLLAAHGAQKLFGWFGGPGVEGTTAWVESMKLRPAWLWARAAGLSEFGGGLLTAAGFLNPLGPIAGLGAMAIATTKVHLGKPIFVSAGGAELPVTNAAVLTGVALAGPGRLSLDRLFGVRLPRLLGLVALAATVASVFAVSRDEIAAVASQPTPPGTAGTPGAGVPDTEGPRETMTQSFAP